MRVYCPSCKTEIGSTAPQGGLKISGLATLLLKSEGRVHGPCKRCKADVEIAQTASFAKSISSALLEPATPRRRTIFIVDDEGSLTPISESFTVQTKP